MRNTGKRLMILSVVFLCSVIFFSLQINRKSVARTVSAEAPSLPTVSVLLSGSEANRMTGYLTDMIETTLRGSVTPVSTEREIKLQIRPNKEKIRTLSYEVTDLVNGSLLENGTVTDLTKNEGVLTGAFRLKKPIRIGQEYGLQLKLEMEKGEGIYYYSRLLQVGSLDIRTYLDFAQNFYETALNKERMNELMNYMESDSTASNASFYHVDIHSSLEQVTWGNLAPELVKKAVPTISEVSDATASVTLHYVISSKNEDDQTEYYTVTDFFRMRDQNKKVMLLDFERTTRQIFDATLPIEQAGGLNLGVGSSQVNAVTSKDGDIAAFVINGDLWSYNQSIGRVSRVFSFRERDLSMLDERAENVQHDIQVSNVSESGDILFAVYGYFSSGWHEGKMGVAVYQFHAEQSTLEEEIFIPLNQSFDTIDYDFGRSGYMSGKGYLYLYMGSQLLKVKVDEGSYSIVQDGLKPEGYVVSDSRKSVAWTEGTETSPASSAMLMDLDSGVTRELKAPEGEKIRILGFFNESIIYGLVRDGDILTDEAGTVTSGMYRLCIADMDGKIAKDYQKDGLYITAVRYQENYLELNLGKKADGVYVGAGQDHIMNKAADKRLVETGLIATERRGQQVTLQFSDPEDVTELRAVYEKYIEARKKEEPLLEWAGDDGVLRYYTYGRGHLISIQTQINQAIQDADEATGVVLDSRAGYVWERANWPSSYKIDLSGLPSGLFTAPFRADALREALGEGYEVLNLSGCRKQALYYLLSRGTPVLGKLEDGSACLIVGYDEYNIWVYDAESENKIKAISDSDSTEMFEKRGNLFLGCRKSE